jgi:hypothetical protein
MSACPLCRGAAELLTENRVSVTSESKTLPAPSQLHLCGHCGHLFTTVDFDWDRYYVESYDSTLTDDGMDEIVSTADGKVVYRTDFDFGLFEQKVLARVSRDARIFELGAGRGRILSRLGKAGFTNVSAFELGKRYREPLSQLIGEGNVFIGERPCDRQFDVLASFFVLEHDVDPCASLAYLRSVAAPGAVLYLMVPNFVTNAIDLACADHAHHFSAATFAAIVEAAGFTIEEVDEQSSIGALIVVARNDGAAPHALRPPAGAVSASRSAAAPYLALRDRIASLESRATGSRRLFLYGAGFYATLARAALLDRPIAGVFDANEKKHGLPRFGTTVRSPAEIATSDLRDAELLVCVNGAVAGTIRERFAPFFGSVACL